MTRRHDDVDNYDDVYYVDVEGCRVFMVMIFWLLISISMLGYESYGP